MDSVIQAITDWLKELLVSGIMGNLTNTFTSVNDQVGQIASDVGQTPSNFSPAIFSMIQNLSENVIMPIAGLLLTFIACYELIQLVISHNNLAHFETWIFFKWVFKTFIAVTLISNTMNITIAVISGLTDNQAARISADIMKSKQRNAPNGRGTVASGFTSSVGSLLSKGNKRIGG